MPKAAHPKSIVISFRISQEINDLLQEAIDKHRPSGANSTRLMARRVVVDFARKRVKYLDPQHLEKDQELPKVEKNRGHEGGAPSGRSKKRTRSKTGAGTRDPQP